ncbi:hypothetical protein B0H34DRAFT_720981 [Crassisporium funariophilum]|nr:hypothetical protein B0H34DRAFT_720981 [Crassisporium funariophilum]
MAALYLHNAIYSRNPSEPQENTFAHSRNLSTISSATLQTSTTLHSQPHEPLLRPTSPRAANYFNQLERIPRNPDGTPARLRWDDQLELDSGNTGEKKGYWGRNTRRPVGRWKWLRLSLEIVLALWATYNTVRYFLAFTVHPESTSQVFCLALGISAGLAFALAFTSFMLSVIRRKHNSLAHGSGSKSLSYFRSTLHYLSSFFLLGPALVSFVLVFIWRHSSNPHFNLGNRCRVDIDVVWSVTNNLCNNKSPPWRIWVALSSLRLALTFGLVIAYHMVSSSHHEIPRRPIHRRLRTDSFPPAGTSNQISPLTPPFNQNLNVQHQISDSTLSVTSRSHGRSLRLARSHSSGLSGDMSPPSEPITFGRSAMTDPENDRDLTGFVDRFRSLLTQITQETDEGLELARSPSPENIRETSPSHHRDLPPSYTEDNDEQDYDDDDDDDDYHDQRHDNRNVFNLPPVPPALGYNEFGLPYPPDENVRMLNGYIRRMPTIESMGSGEVGSSIGASSYRAGESVYTSSRPPTRNTLLSWTSTEYDPPGSGPPSRANSLSARAELLVGLSNINNTTTSEHGELMGRMDPTMRRVSSPVSYMEHIGGGSSGDAGSSGTSASRATTMSYHTATMGSAVDSYPPGLPSTP